MARLNWATRLDFDPFVNLVQPIVLARSVVKMVLGQFVSDVWVASYELALPYIYISLDRSWMYGQRFCNEYIKGLDAFIDFAMKDMLDNGRGYCYDSMPKD
jgi:hypothetical protein